MWEEPGSLKEKRLEVWSETLPELGLQVDPERLERAHDAAHQEYVGLWTAGRQFRVEEAVEHMLPLLDGEVRCEAQDALVGGIQRGRAARGGPSERRRPRMPRGADGGGVRLGIVCDIGLTPSAVVRELLDAARPARATSTARRSPTRWATTSRTRRSSSTRWPSVGGVRARARRARRRPAAHRRRRRARDRDDGRPLQRRLRGRRRPARPRPTS